MKNLELYVLAVSAMKRLGLTQEQVAKAAGTTQVTLSRTISGTHRTSPEIMLKVCKELEISPAIFFAAAGMLEHLPECFKEELNSTLTVEEWSRVVTKLELAGIRPAHWRHLLSDQQLASDLAKCWLENMPK